MRLVVTGEVDGRSVVTSDEPVQPRVLDVFPGAEFYLLWGSDRVPALPTPGDRPMEAWIPGPRGARFGVSVLPPFYGSSRDDLRAGLGEIERRLPGLAPSLELDHPGMHTTDTIDFVLVMSGTVTLELDAGRSVKLAAGDCVVQSGNRHAWRNETDEPCVLAISMVGSQRVERVDVDPS